MLMENPTDRALTRALTVLRSLCMRCFGPRGAHVLLLAPPDAPVLTCHAHAILRAWQLRDGGQTQGVDAGDASTREIVHARLPPFEKLILQAAQGVYLAAGDGSAQFVLMLHSVIAQTQHMALPRVKVTRALAELRQQWASNTLLPELHGALRVSVPIHLDADRHWPTAEFQQGMVKVLRSALAGMVGHATLDWFVQLIIDWIFASPIRDHPSNGSIRDALMHRLQCMLRYAPTAVLHAQGAQLTASRVVPASEFLLAKSLVPSQPISILTPGPIKFVCFTCALTWSDDDAQLVHLDRIAAHALSQALYSVLTSVTQLLSDLKHAHGIRLVITSEPVDAAVVAVCTRLNLACVQYAESEDMTMLCLRAGITPLASRFDVVSADRHVGICRDGVGIVHLVQTPWLQFHGLQRRTSGGDADGDIDDGRSVAGEDTVLQLVLRVTSKGVYKQYYGAVLKSLRVLHSWSQLSSPTVDADVLYLCRGAGATELAIARILRQRLSEERAEDGIAMRGVITMLATALTDVVAQLHTNLNQTANAGSTATRHGVAQSSQRVLLRHALGQLALDDDASTGKRDGLTSFVFYENHCVRTRAGSVSIPQVIEADPLDFGVVHPWRRIDVLILMLLQTAEQVLRIDGICQVRRIHATASSEPNDEED